MVCEMTVSFLLFFFNPCWQADILDLNWQEKSLSSRNLFPFFFFPNKINSFHKIFLASYHYVVISHSTYASYIYYLSYE